MVVIQAARHIHIYARKKSLARGDGSVSGDSVINELGHGSPIAVHQALESPLLLKDFFQREGIGGSR